MSLQKLTQAIVLISIVLGCGVILGLDQFRRQYFLANNQPPPLKKQQSFYPTIVPFKHNRRECEESGRQWQNGECVDRDHSPVF